MTPPEWQLIARLTVGGLTELGFVPGDRQFLVVSHSGRGLFETATGLRLARDGDPPTSNSSWLDERGGFAEGIGGLAGVRIRVVGLWGGTLPQSTRDGWSLRIRRVGGTEQVQLYRSGGHDYFVIEEPFSELRVAGFSNTDRYLVTASSSGLHLFGRAG